MFEQISPKKKKWSELEVKYKIAWIFLIASTLGVIILSHFHL
jgi:hypothetical protein